jgi:predicted DNA-binding transcriptional regulator
LKDRAVGAIILFASLIGLAVYGILLYSFAVVVLQITAFVAVAAVLVISAWIGWTMATTPPPAPLEIPQTSSRPGSTANPQGNGSDKTESV